MPEPAAARPLTDDQVRVVELVARGLTDQQIARQLEVSQSTVQRRIREAARALGASSRTDLAVRAVARGVVPPPEVLP